MRIRGKHPAAALAIALAFGSATIWADAPVVMPSGAELFASRCALCHGAQGGGIPGSFPSLHEQVVDFAKAPAGREYLVMVVSGGLMGSLNVGGVNYNGVMPAQTLSEAEAAVVLNFLASDQGKAELGASAFTASEVSNLRARHPEASPQGTRALRPANNP